MPEGGNKITVTSTSNVPITVSYSYTQAAGFEMVSGSFTDGLNPITSTVLAEGDVTPQSCEAYLTLSGRPPECNLTKIGSVTITVG